MTLLFGEDAYLSLSGSMWTQVGAVAFIAVGLAGFAMLKLHIDRHRDGRPERPAGGVVRGGRSIEDADRLGADDMAEPSQADARGLERGSSDDNKVTTATMAPKTPGAPSDLE